MIGSWNVSAQRPPDLHDPFWTTWLGAIDGPVLVVVGLQEVVNLDSKKTHAKILLKSQTGNGHSNGGATKVALWVDRLTAVLKVAQPNHGYKLLSTQNLVGLVFVAFVRDDISHRISGISSDCVKTGLGGLHGNKGCLALRLLLDSTSLCFINVHLAAGHGKVVDRNLDAAMVLKSTRFDPDNQAHEQAFCSGLSGGIIDDLEHCFFFGDLNYRIDGDRNEVISFIHDGELSELAHLDQLTKQKERNPAFPLLAFEEFPITFAPTYKFDPNSDQYDTSEKQRVPAWCDRILYRCNDSIDAEKSQNGFEFYQSVTDMRISDHRPVHAGVRISAKSIDVDCYNGILSTLTA